jgi:asparagine synthase (glutamine-hydrolysing)
MCGIAGVIRLGSAPLPPPEIIYQMSAAISHRGPDGFGDYRDEFVHIAAVRLSILDIAGGGQPAFNEDLNKVAVYNGELYNFKELSKGLEGRGHQLRSSGDTAVLPHLYEESGPEMVANLRGMFAFAIWDKSSRQVMLCRDRIGIKPFYYALTNNFLIFCSEIKGILSSGLISAEIDSDSLDDLFSISYPFPPRTMFKGIKELLPAHRMIIQAAAEKPVLTERYWRAPFVPQGSHKKISEKFLIDEFKERLRATVKDHMIADVKVGTYLSGGIDSSIVTSFAKDSSSTKLDAFTISFSGTSLDEGQIAQSQANQMGINHHLVPCGTELSELFLKSIYHTELPLQYPLASSFIKLSSAVRELGVKVILTGEGADELLAGYDCFRLERIRGWLQSPILRGVRKSVYRNMFSWLGGADGLAEFLNELHSKPHSSIKSAYGGVKPGWYDIWHMLEPERIDLLTKGNRSPRPVAVPPVGFLESLRPDIFELSELDAALAVELETRLPSWTVLIDDRASMANGIETRVPFLDHKFVEWVVGLPPKMKLRLLTDKYILRQAATGILPNEICKRPKRPFYSPIRELFFDKSCPEFVNELLSESSLAESGLFPFKVVDSLRSRLSQASGNSFEKHRLEWLLVLVLGTQGLWSQFAKNQTALIDDKERVSKMLLKRMPNIVANEQCF